MDVVVAVGVAFVGVRLPKTARDAAQGAVDVGGVVYGQPHGCAHEGIGDLEVGVVLMPVSATAGVARFQEHLIQVQNEGAADHLFARAQDPAFEGQRPQQGALGVQGDELEIGLGA